MTPEQKAAYVNAQAVCALADIAAMQAENAYRQHRGETVAYTEEAFRAIPDKYGIHHNALLAIFHD